MRVIAIEEHWTTKRIDQALRAQPADARDESVVLNDRGDIPARLLDIGEHIGSVTRMQTAAREQAFGVRLHVVGDELVHAIREPDDLRRDVVDEHRTVNATCIQILQECQGRAAELGNLREVRPLLFHELQRLRLEHLHGLNVDVAVGDHASRLGRASSA